MLPARRPKVEIIPPGAPLDHNERAIAGESKRVPARRVIVIRPRPESRGLGVIGILLIVGLTVGGVVGYLQWQRGADDEVSVRTSNSIERAWTQLNADERAGDWASARVHCIDFFDKLTPAQQARVLATFQPPPQERARMTALDQQHLDDLERELQARRKPGSIVDR